MEGERICPACRAQLPPGAVICVSCGLDTRTGRRLATAGTEAGSPISPTATTTFVNVLRRRKGLVTGGAAVLVVVASAILWPSGRGKSASVIEHGNRGLAYYHEGDHDRAIAEFTKVIELSPDMAKAYYDRAHAYAGKGDHARAIADYTKTIELQPDAVPAYVNRGVHYRKKGEYDRAIADYTKAIELDPYAAALYNNRALVYIDKGEYDHAIVDCTKAVEIDPGHADAYFNRGLSHYRKGDQDQAIADYTRATELREGYAAAYYNLACSHSLRAAAHDGSPAGTKARSTDINEALRFLEEAIRSGFSDVEHLRQDSDLDAVRSDPRYREIVSRLETMPQEHE
jgi:tetratricopeptide (TPR) repeat protein